MSEAPLDLGTEGTEIEEPLDLGEIGTEAEADINDANSDLPGIGAIVDDPEARRVLDEYLGLVDRAKTAIEKLSGKPVIDRSSGPEDRRRAYDYLLEVMKKNSEFFNDKKFIANPAVQKSITEAYHNSDNPFSDIEDLVNVLLGKYHEQFVSSRQKPATKEEIPQISVEEIFNKAKVGCSEALNTLYLKKMKGYRPDARDELKKLISRIMNAGNIERQLNDELLYKDSRLQESDYDSIVEIIKRFKIIELEAAFNSQVKNAPRQ